MPTAPKRRARASTPWSPSYLENVSLKRMVTPHDVANVAVFLCSELGRNISGQAIGVDGNVVNI